MTLLKRPSPLATDPGLQAIFDAMLAYMTDGGYNSLNAYTNYDGLGTNVGVTVTAPDGSRWNYGEFIAGVRVAVSPPSIALGPAGTQQFTATASNPDGSAAAGTFTWTMTGLGSIDATGLYVAPAVIDVIATDTIRCTLDSGQSWATVMVTLQP